MKCRINIKGRKIVKKHRKQLGIVEHILSVGKWNLVLVDTIEPN